ncbi:Potassium transporter [Aspergillus fumigatus]
MPCCGEREKGPVSREEKWDSVNLDDFKSESCLTPFSYFLVYVFLLVSIAVYGVDTFTAVNLLAFSRWAGSIEPAIPFTVSRWIFAVCIIVSFVLLFLRWLHAIRAMRSGSIARSYLDPLAARVQSIRMGRRGRGWRRFLVFAELTKSKKGAEYVALFAYFSFESWMNTVFADGPRQVVNAITLYSVMRMDLLPGGKNSVDDDKAGIIQFFENVKILAEDNNQRAVVLCGMLFTLVIWVLSILKLASAVILYLIFLFHHIPAEDGSLKVYCRRKINARLMRIVRRKVDKALAKSTLDRAPTQPHLALDRNPTLPMVADLDAEDKAPTVPTLSRSTTQTTLPPYTSRPGTAAPERNPTLPTLPDVSWTEKPAMSRTVTQSSAHSESTSYSGATAVSGYSPLDRGSLPAPPVPPVPTNVPMPGARSYTPISRPPTTRPTRTPAPPSATNASSRMPTTMHQGDYEEAPRRYPDPYSTDAPYDENYGAHPSYSAAPDPYSRSVTRGIAVSPGEDYPTRTLSPQSHRGTPQPSSSDPPTSYPVRAYTPGNAGTARPPLAVDAAASYAERTYTPVSQRATPRPQQQSSQQQGGYVAFDPSSMAPSQPSAGIRPTHSPVYHAYSGPSSATSPNGPSNRGPPVRAYTPQGYNPHLRPYRPDYA